MRGVVVWTSTVLIGVCVGREGLLTKGGKPQQKEPDGVELVFVNPYETSREVHWINPNGETSLMGVIEGDKGEFRVNTYVGHEFGWRPKEDEEEAQCRLEELEGRVKVLSSRMRRHVLGDPVKEEPGPPEESDELFEATFTNRSPRLMKLRYENGTEVGEVESQGSKELEVRRGQRIDWIEASTGQLLYRSIVERYQHARHTFTDSGHTSLCAEETSPFSPTKVQTFFDEFDQRDVQLEVVNDVPLIVLARNWTVGTECADMEAMAEKTGLAGAQVFGQKTIIADRRALSANLYWDKRNQDALTNRLIQRAFSLAKSLRGYDIHPGPFQEPLNFIRYSVAEEYRPHCDGVCHRAPYKRGGRVATLLHYCKAPDTGGATVFPKLGLKIQPEPGAALLFTYKQDDGYVDDGNTLHAGCLVRQGQKAVVTMWMREDLSPQEPWSDFMS